MNAKRPSMLLRRTAVQLDGLDGADGSPRWFPAFTRGDRWNGFATPLFEGKVADAIVQAFNDRRERNGGHGTRAKYDSAQDAYIFEDADVEDDPEVFVATQVDGQTLYPIGSHSWVWSSNEAEN